MATKKKLSYLNIFKTVIQLIFFVLLPGLYANAFLGVKLLYTGIINRNLNLAQSFPQLIGVLVLIPLTLLLGRFFCGWMCAFGSLGDFMYYLSRKVFKITYKVDEETDKYLKYAKYVILAFIIIAVWTFNVIDLSPLSPWDAFGSLVVFNQLPNFSYVITELTFGFLLLLVIMVASLFIERFFCRYLCPMGAIFAIVSRLKFIKIKKPGNACGPCKACTKKCAMGIPLYQMDCVDSGECINCMQCVQVCPRENAHVEIASAATNPALAGALAVTAITGLYYISTFTSDTFTATQGTTSSVTASDSTNSGLYADGTYEGSGSGYRGATTTVSVTVEGGSITGIEAVSYGDDRQFFDSAFNTIVSEIIAAQSADVDAVSGATFSSNGIMEAVSNALENAKQGSSTSSTTVVEDTTTEDTASTEDAAVTATTAPEAASDETLVADADTAVSDSSTTSSDSTSDNTSDSTSNTDSSTSSNTDSSSSSSTTDTASSDSSSAAVTSPASSSSEDTSTSTSSKYNDGVYEGSGNGFRRGVTTVSVTVKDDTITDIQIVSYGDDAPFFNKACDTVISEILDNQSTNVDAVSGATFSSRGIMSAVADALSSAEIS